MSLTGWPLEEGRPVGSRDPVLLRQHARAAPERPVSRAHGHPVDRSEDIPSPQPRRRHLRLVGGRANLSLDVLDPEGRLRLGVGTDAAEHLLSDAEELVERIVQFSVALTASKDLLAPPRLVRALAKEVGRRLEPLNQLLLVSEGAHLIGKCPTPLGAPGSV